MRLIHELGRTWRDGIVDADLEASENARTVVHVATAAGKQLGVAIEGSSEESGGCHPIEGAVGKEHGRSVARREQLGQRPQQGGDHR